MKFFKLDSAYLPSTTYDNFDSLGWVERYQAPGEFQLKVKNDLKMLSKLSPGMLVSHTDTLEVMLVEDQQLERDEKGVPIVTISGRSFDIFAENRTTAGCEQPLTSDGTTPVVETITGTSAAVAAQILKGRMEPGTASAANAIPNLRVVSTIRAPDASMTQVIKRSDAYSRVAELMGLGKFGLANRRPNGAQGTLDLIVSDGRDLTATVTFYVLNDDLTDCKYLWSIRDYRNYARVAANTATREYRTRALAADVTGLDRRVIYEEASDLKGAFSPPTATDPIASRGQNVLDAQVKLYLMEAKVTETARPKFKMHYDVGDIVTVLDEFQVSQKMRVTEHILTVDEKGVRGYPSLSAL